MPDVYSMEERMEIKDLGHVVFFVHDLKRSVHFYRDVLGFHLLGNEMPGAAAFVSASNRTHHELLLIEVGRDAPDPAAGRRAGFYHMGLKVGDTIEELKSAIEDLNREGVQIVGMSDHTVSKSVYLLDPDGNEIEIYVDADPAVWRNNPAAVMTPTKPLRL
jgi:catechol 2,3-dioxygenase